MLAEPLPDSGPLELLRWLLRLRRRARVDGASMIPTLAPGDEVLFDARAYRTQAPVAGDIVVARRPDRQDVVLVKRVAAQLADGRFVLKGDNPTASTDSRSFGAVAKDDLLGKVTSRFA